MNCTDQPSRLGSLLPGTLRLGNQAAAYCRLATASIAIRLEKAISVMKPVNEPSNGPCENSG
ncbi:hypothetical protein D3C81_1091750 [compost metagenome]